MPTNGMARAFFSQTRKAQFQHAANATRAVSLGGPSMIDVEWTRCPSMRHVFMFVLVTVTQCNRGLVILAREERGEAHCREPCSRWQAEEMRYPTQLGATRGALYTCETAMQRSQHFLEKGTTLGLLSNLELLGTDTKRGWPVFKYDSRQYTGKLAVNCKCGMEHVKLEQSRAHDHNLQEHVCAEFLSVLPRKRGS